MAYLFTDIFSPFYIEKETPYNKIKQKYITYAYGRKNARLIYLCYSML